MIIMMAANRMNPTAQLVASRPRLVRYPVGVCSVMNLTPTHQRHCRPKPWRGGDEIASPGKGELRPPDLPDVAGAELL